MEKQYHVLADNGSSGIERATGPREAIEKFAGGQHCRASEINEGAPIGRGRFYRHSTDAMRWWFVEEACAVCERQWHIVVSSKATLEVVAANGILNAVRRAEHGPGAGAELQMHGTVITAPAGQLVREAETKLWWFVLPGSPAAPPAVRDGTIQEMQEAYDDLQEQYEELRSERDKMKDWIDGMAKHLPRVGYTPEGEQIVVPAEKPRPVSAHEVQVALSAAEGIEHGGDLHYLFADGSSVCVHANGDVSETGDDQ